VTLTYPDLITI